MKRKGTTKVVDLDKASETAGSSGKRQLPLDFSGHALRSKRTASNHLDENATKMASGSQLTGTLSDSPTHPSVLDPPVIHVNLAASRIHTCTQSVDGTSRCTAEVETVTSASSSSTAGQQDSTYRELSGEDDDDDGLLRPRARGKSPASLTDEGELDPSGDPSMLDDDKRLDVILPPKFRWKTVYVAAFELALDTVVPDEAFLFADEELALFETYRELPDDPKHLFVRLFLRNQKYWQRQSKLDGRYREIEDLGSAIQQLSTAGLLMDQDAMNEPKEAIALLTVDELKILARKIGLLDKMSGKPRDAMVSMILGHFRQQSFISKRMLTTPRGVSQGQEGVTGLATHVFSGDSTKRDKALIDKVVDISGPCIKIYPNVMRVFERLHLVFHRSREYSDRPALQEAILAKIGRRVFPTYEITRTNTVFRDRDELLKYEAAIKLHHDISEMIDSAMGPGRSATVYVRDGGRTSGNDGLNASRRPNGSRSSSKPGGHEDEDTEQERRRLEVIGIYENVIKEVEGIRDAWRHYVSTETELCKNNPNYFLLRFSPGWVYTQILRLEMRAFAFLKRFEEESILLHELLDQHIYSLGQRGGWYERLALIKSNYAYDRRLGKQEALHVCMMALRDRHVHAVDATLIQSRILRLESELKVPFRDRHDFSYLTLRKAQKRILTGERLNTPGTAAPSYASSHSYSYIPNSMGSSPPTFQQRPLWRNIDGSDCSVEELALSYYGTLGYKGHHSENSILLTLFGLLFWDILFSPQPGVFETSYQTEPLDLRTDAFFLQRQDMIMERIENIAKSKIIEDPEPLSPHTTGLRNMAKNEATTFEQGGRELAEEDDSEEEELLRRGRRPRRASVREDQGPTNDALVESELKQDPPEYPGIITSERNHDEFVEKKRKECFYLDLLQKHDDLYRAKNVFCVGVNWVFSKEDLLQIAECIGGDALSGICKILAQEYNKRCSGMPDLW
ncbi:MAG: hypothetical protein J3Q66DRAFT_105131 [Benniella sp.]|nr:MAG: hypothetical protein J3Q66DRAFT_105131 [Benniella sp.]